MADSSTERRAQMFPELTADQIHRISSLGERRNVRMGEILFEVGEQDTKFLVVIEGVRPVGVFVVGDARSGSAKGVASAVGEEL